MALASALAAGDLNTAAAQFQAPIQIQKFQAPIQIQKFHFAKPSATPVKPSSTPAKAPVKQFSPGSFHSYPQRVDDRPAQRFASVFQPLTLPEQWPFRYPGLLPASAGSNDSLSVIRSRDGT